MVKNTCMYMQVIAEWQGDFASTSSFPNLKTKYLIQPDERYSYSYYTHSHANSMFNTENSAQVHFHGSLVKIRKRYVGLHDV